MAAAALMLKRSVEAEGSPGLIPHCATVQDSSPCSHPAQVLGQDIRLLASFLSEESTPWLAWTMLFWTGLRTAMDYHNMASVLVCGKLRMHTNFQHVW
jgi:hypothetical protein